MPQINLPSRGEKPYDTRLNAAIMEINQEVDRTAAEVTGRLSGEALNATIGGAVGEAVLPRARRNALTGWFHVDGFGAKGDGATDDTDAIQAAINATQTNTNVGVTGGHIYFPPGEYRITRKLNLFRFSGSISGAGLGNSPAYTPNRGNGSVIRWDGPSTEPMLFLRDYRNVVIENIRLEGKDDSKPTYGIESNWRTGDTVGTNASLHVKNVHIGVYPWSSQGTSKGAMQAAIGFTGDNGNNDQFELSDLVIANCDVGIDLPNAQSIWGQISNVAITTSTVAAIRTSAGFTGFNLSFDNNAVDLLVNSTAAVTVYGWFSERSAKHLHCTGLGRVSVFGGKWRLQAPMVAGSNFVQHDLATNQAGVFLYGVELVNTLTPHPKVKLTAAGGGGANGGWLVMQGVSTTMTVTDFDVVSVGGNALNVDIDAGQLAIHARFNSATTLGAAHSKPALAPPATDANSAQALANDMRAKLIATGWFS